MSSVWGRVLAAVIAAVVWWFVVLGAFLLAFIAPLSPPNALDACADPCFGPPATYRDVLVQAVWAAVFALAWSLPLGVALSLSRVALRGRGLTWQSAVRIPPVTLGGLLLAIALAQIAQAGSAVPERPCPERLPASLRSPDPQQRLGIAEAVERCHLLAGLGREAVVELLGAPPGPRRADSSLVYPLADERRLVVRFSRGGIATAFVERLGWD